MAIVESLYADSSAVLRWLLNEPDRENVAKRLREAKRVLASELTILECQRMLVRLVAAGSIGENSASRRQSDLHHLAREWDLWGITKPVLARAGLPWPREPLRSLDSIHLATLALARTDVPDLKLVSLDNRLRENASALGFELVPPAT